MVIDTNCFDVSEGFLYTKIHFMKQEFVAEVLQMTELDGIKDALVGFPGVSGISNEQRKRLTYSRHLMR